MTYSIFSSVTGQQQKVKSRLIWHLSFFSFCAATYN